MNYSVIGEADPSNSCTDYEGASPISECRRLTNVHEWDSNDPFSWVEIYGVDKNNFFLFVPIKLKPTAYELHTHFVDFAGKKVLEFFAIARKALNKAKIYTYAFDDDLKSKLMLRCGGFQKIGRHPFKKASLYAV